MPTASHAPCALAPAAASAGGMVGGPPGAQECGLSRRKVVPGATITVAPRTFDTPLPRISLNTASFGAALPLR